MWLLLVRDIGSTLLLFSLHILLLWAVTRENLRLYPPWVVSFITAAKWKSSSISLYVCTTMSYDALRCQCGCFRPQIDNLSPPWPSVCFSSLYYYLLSEGIRVVKRYLDCQVHSSGDSGLTSNLHPESYVHVRHHGDSYYVRVVTVACHTSITIVTH